MDPLEEWLLLDDLERYLRRVHFQQLNLKNLKPLLEEIKDRKAMLKW